MCDEVLEELRGHVLVHRIGLGQLQRHREHRRAEEGHPGGAVGLLEEVARPQRLRAIEDADVVEPEEPAREQVSPRRVLAVDPPGEVEEQLLEHPREKSAIALAVGADGDLVDAPGGPGVHRRVHVAEGVLVGRELAVRVHVPLARQQDELLLGEARIDAREGDHVERQIPGGVPGVLPLVGHRDDVAVVEVPPLGVAPRQPARGRRWHRGIAVEPGADVVVIELLRPEQPGVGLANHEPLVGRERAGLLRVEGIGLGPPGLHHGVEVGERRRDARPIRRSAVISASRSRTRSSPPAGTLRR